jgi:preprotein translocase subunit SecG
MESVLLTINIILAVLLIIVILLQRSEGGALGLGVSQDNFTSSRSAGDFLTKFTSILAVFFIITSIALVSISRFEIREVQSVIDLEKEKDQNKNLPQIPENQK